MELHPLNIGPLFRVVMKYVNQLLELIHHEMFDGHCSYEECRRVVLRLLSADSPTCKGKIRGGDLSWVLVHVSCITQPLITCPTSCLSQSQINAWNMQ